MGAGARNFPELLQRERGSIIMSRLCFPGLPRAPFEARCLKNRAVTGADYFVCSRMSSFVVIV